MGHHYTEISAIGKDRSEAFELALEDFFHEEGHRHSLRGGSYNLRHRDPRPAEEDGKIDEQDGRPRCYGRLIELVPPSALRREVAFGSAIITAEPNPSAPREEWSEHWEFRIHTHA